MSKRWMAVLFVTLLVILATATAPTPSFAEQAPLMRITFEESPTPFYHVFEFSKMIARDSEMYNTPGPKEIDKKTGLEDLAEKLFKIEGIHAVKVSPYEIRLHFSKASEPWRVRENVKKIIREYFKSRGYRVKLFPAP